VTLDADLQNPPEEIGNLVAKMREGYDYVGSIRRKRQDSAWRTYASKAMNHLRERSPTSRSPTRAICCAPMAATSSTWSTSARGQYLRAGAGLPFSRNPTEIMVEHEERAAGESKYSLYSLIRLNFDLVTGFSLVPLQFFSLMGIGCRSRRRRCWSSSWCAACSSAPKRRRLHAVCDCLLPDGRDPVRHRPAGRIHRPHLQQVRAPALRGAGHP
jgi:hypothetical protein